MGLSCCPFKTFRGMCLLIIFVVIVLLIVYHYNYMMQYDIIL